MRLSNGFISQKTDQPELLQHAVVSKPSYRGKAWSAYSTKEPLGFASALGIDYTHDKQHAVLVAFGADSRDPKQQPSVDPTLITKWLGQLDPALPPIHERSIWHEWTVDPYLRGGWSQFEPNFYKKFWSELVKPHGNVQFASADYPVHGWKVSPARASSLIVLTAS